MIRFIDLTKDYWLIASKPMCAFLDTITDTFIQSATGCHTFDCWDDIDGCRQSDDYIKRMRALVPPRFFDLRVEYEKK